MRIAVLNIALAYLVACFAKGANTDAIDEEYGVRYASSCEVCKYLSRELQDSFEELGQTSQVIETGYQIDGPKKRIDYKRSELYYIEALDNVCDRLLAYNIHKERKDSTRFAKGRSSTFSTLHQLSDKGVKVELGIPKELWDSPSAEITNLKQQCEDSLEKYEDIIQQWYWSERKTPLEQYLCRERVLNKENRSCLDDPPAPLPTTNEHNQLDSETKSSKNKNNFHRDIKTYLNAFNTNQSIVNDIMDYPQFSQIPNIILKKAKTDRPHINLSKRAPKLFTTATLEEPPSILPKVCPPVSPTASPPREHLNKATPIDHQGKEVSIVPCQRLPLKNSWENLPRDSTVDSSTTCDAIVQTDSSDEKPKVISRKCQTELSFFEFAKEYDDYRTKLQADALALYKPIYTLKNNSDVKPPLKIGLTLPRGIKRKVFYPGDESE